jgi:hypothetical protein
MGRLRQEDPLIEPRSSRLTLGHSETHPFKKKKKTICCWAPVAQTCNPSYSGGKDQDYALLANPSKQFMRPYLEKTHYKRGLVECLKVYPEFTPQYRKKINLPGAGGSCL